MAPGWTPTGSTSCPSAFFFVTTASIGYFVFIIRHRIHNLRSAEERRAQVEDGCRRRPSSSWRRRDHHSDVRATSFHKVCIEPWLLDKRTCPMCKCDILKPWESRMKMTKTRSTLRVRH
ncbi:hypothetical protein CRUP_036867 [Coryphaenoides rupestris]|nr:hypothetical protein CRUP_036867 [Coryphaenoides rupestris]